MLIQFLCRASLYIRQCTTAIWRTFFEINLINPSGIHKLIWLALNDLTLLMPDGS
jgi:hypothetical protein